MSSDDEWPVEVWAELARERRKDPWNRVVNLVHNGKLSTERAEAWARERGLPAFESRPAPGEHDPMAAIDWTLAMVTAWIIWQTPQAVQECMEAYVDEVRFWVPHHYQRAARRGASRWVRVRGFELKAPDTPTPKDVLIRASVGKASGSVTVLEPERAKRELRDALRSGDLVARAGRQAEPIEKTRWSVLSPFASGRHGRLHDAVYDEDGEVQFSRVTVERDAVLKRWEKLSKKSSGKQRGPTPDARDSIKARMLADLRSGKLLSTAIRSKLHHTYGAGRTTCEAAFKEAMLEFETPANSGNN